MRPQAVPVSAVMHDIRSYYEHLIKRNQADEASEGTRAQLIYKAIDQPQTIQSNHLLSSWKDLMHILHCPGTICVIVSPQVQICVVCPVNWTVLNLDTHMWQ